MLVGHSMGGMTVLTLPHLFPEARLETLEPAGHMALFERHEPFLAALEAFSLQCTARRPGASSSRLVN